MAELPAEDGSLRAKLEAFEAVAFERRVWRVCPGDRDPLQWSTAPARWSTDGAPALYTSLSADGAIAEFVRTQSRDENVRSLLVHELLSWTRRALVLRDMGVLRQLGVRTQEYGDDQHRRCQEIGRVARAIGFDSIVAPNAHWPCQNLVVFATADDIPTVRVVSSRSIGRVPRA